MNDNNDTLEAENPNPLKPLTNDAKKITVQKKIKSNKSNFVNFHFRPFLKYNRYYKWNILLEI